MAQVKVEPVSGGRSVKVRVERGNEVYDQRDGLLYEERTVTVDELREQLVSAIKEGKRMAQPVEESIEEASGGNG